MLITSYERGHKIYYEHKSKIWRYCDTDEYAEISRKCPRCGKYPTKEGYDACLGHIEGALSACCGHGVRKGYVVKQKKRRC